MANTRRVTIDGCGLRLKRHDYTNEYRPNTSIGGKVNVVKCYRQITPLAQEQIKLSHPEKPVEIKPEIDIREPSELIEVISQIQKQPVVINPNPKKTSILHRMFSGFRASVVSLASILLLIGGGISLVVSLQSNRAVITQVQALGQIADESNADSDAVATGGVQTLDETKVSDQLVRSYAVAPDQPKYLSIPALNISQSRIRRMGIDKDGSIQTPNNIWDSGWYEGSLIPSPTHAIGASLIVGHLSGPTEGGIFYNLHKLNEGDLITVTLGDGGKVNYRVVGKEEVPLDGIDMDRYLVSQNIDKPGLTLMTCSGKFNSATQLYENRLAVFAVQES